MRIRRCAAAEESQGLGGGDLVPRTGRDQDGIAGSDVLFLAVDFHDTLAFEDEVKLLAQLVVVALCGASHGNGRLGQALVGHRRVGAVQNTADRAAVLGGKGWLLGKLVDRHGHIRYC